MTQENNNKRLTPLDSLRGIAALLVVLHHCWGVKTLAAHQSHTGWQNAFASFHDLFRYIIEKSLETGRAAVMIFFVLSGFVLAYSLLARPVGYGKYVVKRVFRIYPVFAFIIIVSFVLHTLLAMQDDVNSGWLAGLHSIPGLSFVILAKHLLMFGNWRNDTLDPAMWSLVHEMRISLIFPFILLSVRRYGGYSILAYFLFSVGCTGWTLYRYGQVSLGVYDETVLQTFLSTGYFIVFFAAGAFLAMKQDAITPFLAGLAAWKKTVLFLLTAACLLKTDLNNHLITGAAVDYLRGLGALLLIALTLNIPAFAHILRQAAFLWLGRISYSLYLVHFPVIYTVNHFTGASASVTAVGISIVFFSLLAAECCYRIIEGPFIKIGKNIVKRIGEPRRALSVANYENLEAAS